MRGVKELVVGGGVTPSMIGGGGACRRAGGRIATEHLLHALLEPATEAFGVGV